ncbi:MAG: polysaccharide deacetylase family protein [Candidatus Sumerlaeaceae bacterium]
MQPGRRLRHGSSRAAAGSVAYVCAIVPCVLWFSLQAHAQHEFAGPYVFGASDSLAAIAGVCGTTSHELLALNHLTWQTLREGQVLRLPPNCFARETTSPSFFSPRVQMAREIWRGPRGQRALALTFDAGGELESAPELLDVLIAEHIPATFFVTGAFARRNSDWVCRAAAAGYPIFNHSWSHPYFTKLTDAQIQKELKNTDDLIASLTGRTTRPYWRPPYGDRNAHVLRAAAAAGFRSVYWTLDSLDSYGEPKSPQFLVDRVTNPKASLAQSDDLLDGAIILMHVNVKATRVAVPEIAARLRERGFTLVALPALLEPKN